MSEQYQFDYEAMDGMTLKEAQEYFKKVVMSNQPETTWEDVLLLDEGEEL